MNPFTNHHFGRVLRLAFGRDKVNEIGSILSKEVSAFSGSPGRRALLVTDLDSKHKQSRQRVLATLRNSGVECQEHYWRPLNEDFPGLEPCSLTVTRMVEQIKRTGCTSVVAVGCSTTMRLAKAVSRVASSDLKRANYMKTFHMEDEVGIVKKPEFYPASVTSSAAAAAMMPVITVPVLDTMGEEGAAYTSVVEWSEDPVRYWLSDESVRPTFCITDPSLMEGDEPTVAEVATSYSSALFRIIDVWLSEEFENDSSNQMVLDGLTHLSEVMHKLKVDGAWRTTPVTPDEFESLAYGSVCTGVAWSLYTNGHDPTTSSTAKLSSTFGGLGNKLGETGSPSLVKRPTGMTSSIPPHLSALGSSSSKLRGSLFGIITTAVSSVLPLGEQQVMRTVFLPTILREREYCSQENFEFTDLQRHAATRSRNFDSLEGYVGGMVLGLPESESVLDWLEGINALLPVQKLDQLGFVIDETLMEVLVQRILETAHQLNVPADRTLVQNIFDDCLSKPFFK